MTKKLPDLIEKLTEDQAHGSFVQLSAEDFGNGSSPRLAKMFGTSSSTMDRWRKKITPGTKKNWDQQRDAIYGEVSGNVQAYVIEKETEYKKTLIEKTIARKKLIDEKIDSFLEDKNFKINDGNLVKLLEVSEKIGMNLAKYLQLVEGKNKKNGVQFLLTVPNKGLNPWGRQWVMDQMKNPVNAIDADYEVVRDDEESMQRKLLNENTKA